LSNDVCGLCGREFIQESPRIWKDKTIPEWYYHVPTSTVVYYLEEGLQLDARKGNRQVYIKLLQNVLGKLEDPNNTVRILRTNQDNGDSDASVNFGLSIGWCRNQCHRPFARKGPGRQGWVMAHELGRYYNGMHLDGGNLPYGAKVVENVNIWDQVIELAHR